MIVAKLDRFARSNSGALHAVEDIENHGGVLISVNEQIDTSTPAGKFLRAILFAAAEWEKDRIGEQWLTARTSATRRGIVISHHVPPGYMRGPRTDDEATDRRLAPHPAYAEPVREVFRMAPYSSDAELARYMNDCQIPVFSHKHGEKPTHWQSFRIPRLLANRVYLGEARHGKELVNKKAHEPLVTEEEWLAAQRISPGSPLRKPARGRKPEEISILSGLCRCAGCRFAMSPQSGNARVPSHYRCTKTSVHGVCPQPSSITKRKVEDYVIEQFIARHEQRAAGRKRESTDDGAVLKLEREAQGAHRSYQAALTHVELRMKIGDTDHDRMVEALYDAWQTRLDDFDDARATQGGEVVELVPEGVPLREFVGRLLAENRNEELRRLLASGIDVIFVRPAASRARNQPAADRIKIVFRGDETLALPPRRGNRDRAFRPHAYVW